MSNLKPITCNLKPQSGYIALTSAIIISALLLGITVSLSLDGFFARTNIVDATSKEQSSALAEACIQVAILDIAQNTIPTSFPAVIPVGNSQCSIISINGDAIQSQAQVNKAFTNLKADIDSNFIITSLQECPTSPCP